MNDDAELLAAWADGDGHAGEALFERNFSAVCRFFRNKVDGSIDDLVQKTFLGCLEGRARLEGSAGFRGYLFGVARNVLNNHYRGRAIDRQRDRVDVEEMSVFELGVSPTSVYSRDREQLAMLNALRRIPLDAQVILELCYWEALSAAEIGVVLGIPLGTAKTRIRRARALFAARLADVRAGRLPWHTTGTGFETWARGVRGPQASDGSREKIG